MSDSPDNMRDADAERLRELAKDIPWERPTASRRDGIRSSLLVEAAESNAAPTSSPRRYVAIGSAFVAGALAAAAIAIIVVRRDTGVDRTSITPTQITASPDAKLDHQIVQTDTGVDEIVQIRDGKVRLAVPAVRRGDHVRVETKTAFVEGDAGELDVVVVRDSLESVTVRTGSARVVVAGRATFLSAGQTWRASVITTDLSPSTPDRVAVHSSDTPDKSDRPVDAPDTNVRSQDASDTAVRSPDKSDTAVRPADTKTPVRPADATNRRPSDATAKPGDAKAGDAKPNITGDAKPNTGDAKPNVTGDAKPNLTFEPPRPNVPSIAPVRSPDPTNRDATKGDATNRDVTKGDATKGDAKDPPKPDTSSDPAKHDPMKPTIVEPAKPDRSKQTAVEQQFRKGWELLRTGKAREAAIELGAAADAMPESPLAADARYWQAVALIRAGQSRDAERVLVQFLDTAPKSLRRGRAAVLLGRVLAERGDKKSATAWFESAIHDPDPAIANAARAGLQALQKP